MRPIRSLASLAVAALLLAACGGGDPDVPGSGSPAGAPTTKGNFGGIVSFGDSLSDVGAYTPATSATGDGNPPFLGGKFTTNSAAHPVYKILASAMANGEENFGVSRDDMFIYRIFADEAPTRKWRRFGARGRFKPILRRNSHVTVVLRERGS